MIIVWSLKYNIHDWVANLVVYCVYPPILMATNNTQVLPCYWPEYVVYLKRPLKLLHSPLILMYYCLWPIGSFQPSCMTNVPTSIFVSLTSLTFAAIHPSLQLIVFVNISQLIRYARACSSCGDLIDRERLHTEKLVDQGYTLEKLKIYFRNGYGRYNDLVQHYNTPLYSFGVTWSSVGVRVTYTGFDPTGYYWLYSWFHCGCVATSGEVYCSREPIHTLAWVFPIVFVVLSVTFIPGFVMIMDNKWYLISGWRTVISFLIPYFSFFLITTIAWWFHRYTMLCIGHMKL